MRHIRSIQAGICALFLGAAALTAASLASAHQSPRQKTQDPRSWLEHQAGGWTSAARLTFGAGPDAPTMDAEGDMQSRMLGDRWLITEGEIRVEGEAVPFLQTLGYDEQKKRFVGSWIDTASSHMWMFEGDLDGDTLVLESTGPSCLEPGRITEYREAIELTGDGMIERRSTVLLSTGEWVEYMVCEFRRKE